MSADVLAAYRVLRRRAEGKPDTAATDGAVSYAVRLLLREVRR